MSEEKFAIRFGLGAIKAVGFGIMENAVKEREANGKFENIYNFAERVDPKSVNKKSIEALAKAGAFDSLIKNRKQVAESFEILSSYSSTKNEENTSDQMSLFGGLPEANIKPDLKKTQDWNKTERLQKEFEAFGFFLNEHPVDDFLPDLKKRGVIFSDKLERDELEDNNLVKMAGVVAGSKHRSSARGRFAYLTISDPFGIFEAMIFDEAIITNARDILVDGSSIALECLIRKDEGGIRILVRSVGKLDEFIRNTKPSDKDFEDIKKQANRGNNRNYEQKNNQKSAPINTTYETKKEKKIFREIEIILMSQHPIIILKSLLSQRVAPESITDTTKIFFVIGQNKIELPQKYLLEESDILRIKNISGISSVKIIS